MGGMHIMAMSPVFVEGRAMGLVVCVESVHVHEQAVLLIADDER